MDFKQGVKMFPAMNEEIVKKANLCRAADLIAGDVSGYIDFAYYLLDNKIESDNVFILAGLSESEKEDARRYFGCLLLELDIKTDLDNIDYLYICYLNEKIHEGKKNAHSALAELKDFYVRYEKEIYFEFYGLYYMLDYVDMSEAYNMEHITSKNMDEYIKRAFELFVEMYGMEVPEDFCKQAYCRLCGKRGIPLFERKKTLFGKTKHNCICPNCKRSNLYKWSYCSANSGKELYLKEIGREGVVCKPDAWL